MEFNIIAKMRGLPWICVFRFIETISQIIKIESLSPPELDEKEAIDLAVYEMLVDTGNLKHLQ